MATKEKMSEKQTQRMFNYMGYKDGMVEYNSLVSSGEVEFPKTLVIKELDDDKAEVSTTGGSGASSDSVLLARVRKHGKEYKLNPKNYDFLANGKEPIIIDEDGGYRHIQYAYKTYKIDVEGEDKKVVWNPSVHDEDNEYFINDDESIDDDESKTDDESIDDDNK
jgi:hypothetical protein|tara:strand:- start:880 stop:1374 length:495 start_codon:yes stop_codon:yes gene_type:complete